MATEVVLDDNAIRSLLQKRPITDAFPFFKNMTRTVTAGDCRCKRRKQRSVKVPDYIGIRHAIVALPLEQKRTLKRMLNASFVVLRNKRADGTIVKVRF